MIGIIDSSLASADDTEWTGWVWASAVVMLLSVFWLVTAQTDESQHAAAVLFGLSLIGAVVAFVVT